MTTKFSKFEKYANAPVIIFHDDRRKEWENADPTVKKWVEKHLLETCSKLSLELQIETLCHVINDLSMRIDELEKTK